MNRDIDKLENNEIRWTEFNLYNMCVLYVYYNVRTLFWILGTPTSAEFPRSISNKSWTINHDACGVGNIKFAINVCNPKWRMQ